MIAVAALLITTSVAAAKQTNTKEAESVISADDYFSRTIQHQFYDLKLSTGAIKSEKIAYDLFVEDRMSGVRIPIFGNDKRPAHPASGVVERKYYDSMIRSIRNAKAASKDDILIFASKKLDGKTSFPAWVKGKDGEVDTKLYSELLVDFILFMKDNDMEIDYLAVDNEYEFNEGRITPQRYIEIVNYVKAAAKEHGFKTPIFVGAERYEPMGDTPRNWVEKLLNTKGGAESMDIYGTHYYPKHRFYDRLVYDMSLIGDREVWATEPHWGSKVEDQLAYADKAICTLWDHTDLGVDCFIWWGYSRSGNYTGYIKRAVSTPLPGSRPIRVTDPDGESIREEGKLQVRAFRNGDQIDLYVINVATEGERSFKGYTFELDSSEGYRLKGGIECRQWSDNDTPEGDIVRAKADGKSSFSLNIPHRSITHITFRVK